MPDPSLLPVERIERAIFMLRGHKVMLDAVFPTRVGMVR
jgi:hypothetical protein